MRKMIDSEIPIVVFDNSSKKRVLDSLGFKEGKNSELVDENDKIITNQSFESITSEEFGGVLKSSKLVIKNEESELVKYFINKEC